MDLSKGQPVHQLAARFLPIGSSSSKLLRATRPYSGRVSGPEPLGREYPHSPQALVGLVIRMCRRRPISIAANSDSSSTSFPASPPSTPPSAVMKPVSICDSSISRCSSRAFARRKEPFLVHRLGPGRKRTLFRGMNESWSLGAWSCELITIAVQRPDTPRGHSVKTPNSSRSRSFTTAQELSKTIVAPFSRVNAGQSGKPR